MLHRLQIPAGATVRRALRDPHPAVRAAAALLLWREQDGPMIIEAVLRGAIGLDRELAADCRSALADPRDSLMDPARRALQRNAEPDLYGQLHPLSSGQREWLSGLLQHTGGH